MSGGTLTDVARDPGAVPAPPRSRARQRRHSADRPRFLWVVTALVGVWLFTPIVVVVLFSLNSRRSLTAFGSFSLRWYRTLFEDPAARASIEASLRIATSTMIVATLLGTLLAFGIARGSRRAAAVPESVLLVTLVTPEIATAVALFLLFTTLHYTLSLTTVTLGHITFSIVYVTVIVRARLATLSREVEEAAMDLGATERGTFRLIVLPQLWPAIIGGALLVFVLSFDDFVTSFFTSGVGVSPLPVLIYGMVKFGISPEINAIGTLMMMVSVVLGIAGIVIIRSRTRSHRPADMTDLEVPS